MPIQSWGKNGVPAYLNFGPNIGHNYLNINFKFVLPIINIKGKTNVEVNLTQIDHPLILKTTKMAISQNAVLANCVNFQNHYYYTFIIDVNMDFANDLRSGFLI